jgi:DNA-directed RNA polymerase subunit beta'
MLKGKQGRFRRNLLGKRVDYSGRSVIVIGPHLELHQCGLPKGMALELFRPFVIRKLVEYNYAVNVKGAKRIVEQARPEVWEVLEEVIKERPVLLNRAPTLHRLGIQAFEAVLVEGHAIQIHPLVCAAFNADFDGDQMAVHIPLSKAAIEEAQKLMHSTKNLLLPANGEPIVGPSKDMVLGCYYLTMEREGCLGEGKIFANLEEVALAYDLGKVDLHARIKVHQVTSKPTRRKKPIETTVGRALFNEVLPEELRFVNEVMDRSKLKDLVARCYQQLGPMETAKFVDKIKDIGFRYATQSGLTIAVSDITVPEAKAEILEHVTDEVNAVEHQYRRGLITEDEQYVKTVELWTRATDEITEAVAQSLDATGPIRWPSQEQPKEASNPSGSWLACAV